VNHKTTKVNISMGDVYFTQKYAPPDTCTYYAYQCTYCESFFHLVDPKTFEAGGAIRTVTYKNSEQTRW
jgi:hypothetical protein